MAKLMERLWNNIADAKAFSLSFTNFSYMYDDYCVDDFYTVECEECKKTIQTKDYLFPRASCTKPTSILDTLEYGVSQELRDELIALFDVTEEDFRPIRSKRGEIVYYQITPQHIMLPISEENEWIPRTPCPCCGSIQYDEDKDFENENEEFYHYISQAALDDMHDFNVTYERFRWHRPLFVISRRVYDFLTERYPRTHYEPFFLKSDF